MKRAPSGLPPAAGPLPAPAPAFRRRTRDGALTALLDEALDYLRSDGRDVLRLLLPFLVPILVTLVVFVWAHRAVWIGQGWDGVAARSGALSLAVVVAWGLRGVGHARVAAHVLRRLESGLGIPLAPPRPGVDVLGHMLLALLGPGAVLAGGIVGGIPGILAAGWFAPIPALLLSERRGLASALLRSVQLPRGTVARSAGAAALLLVVLGIVWLNLLIGAQAVMLLLSALTGMDMGLLSRALGPGSEVFLVGSMVLAAVLVDPLWAVVRVLLYVDARLRESGADLLAQWSTLRGRAAVVLLVLTASVPLAQAQDGAELLPEAGVPAGGELAVDGGIASGPRSLDHWLLGVKRAREPLVGSLDAWKEGEFLDTDGHRDWLRDSLGGEVLRPDGSFISLDGSALVDGLPAVVHDEGTRNKARLVVARVDRAIATAEAMLRGTEETSLGVDPRSLLESARRHRGGRVADRAEGDAWRRDLKERFLAWLRDLFKPFEQEPQPARNVQLPDGLGTAVLVIVVLFVLTVLVLLILRRGALQRGPALPAAARPDGDARRFMPLDWWEQARRLALDGRHRDAVRALYLGSIHALDRGRLIDYQPHRTGREHAAGFRGDGELRVHLHDAVDRYERAWFGAATPGPADFEAMERCCLPLREVLPVARSLPGDSA